MIKKLHQLLEKWKDHHDADKAGTSVNIMIKDLEEVVEELEHEEAGGLTDEDREDAFWEDVEEETNRDNILRETNEAYANMSSEERAEEQKEQKVWDSTVPDGLKDLLDDKI